MLSVRQRSIEKKTGTNAMCKEVQFEGRTRTITKHNYV